MSHQDLRSAYSGDGGLLEVFSSKVQDYVRSRPAYPDALYDHVAAAAELRAGAIIADLGAGTGLLTRGWLARGHSVVAVEPNAEMRAAADALLGSDPHYRSCGGTGEATGLAAGSVDLVTAAQSFHWFDPVAARAECLRILVPHGIVALIWNDRVADAPLNVGLDSILERHGGAQRTALLNSEVGRAGVGPFFGAGRLQVFAIEHVQQLDMAGLCSLVFSRTYMPRPGSAEASAVEGAVQALFAKHAEGGSVSLPYRCVAYLGRPA